MRLLASGPTPTNYQAVDAAPRTIPLTLEVPVDTMDATTPVGGHSLTQRMLGAATLDIATYEEVEHDTTATTQAAIVVGIVAVCAGIGGVGAGKGGIITGVLSAYIGWLVWSGVTYLIGAKVFGGTATWGELLRTVGFAQTPGIFYALRIIPLLGAIVAFVVWIWMLVAGVVAIRQALDFSTGKAVLTALLGLICYVIVAAVIGSMLGLGTAAL